MPYTINIHPEARIAVITGKKMWSGPDLLGSARELVHDPLFEPDFDWIHDLSNIDGVNITPYDVERNMELLRSFRDQGLTDWDDSRTVIVATHPDVVSTGTLHKHMAKLESESFAVKETLQEAYDWLGLSEYIPLNDDLPH